MTAEPILPRVRLASTVIPPMTHRLGRHWDQPDLATIWLDEQKAYMTQAAFDALLEYSSTYPTGVYAGKAWKGQITKLSRITFGSGSVPADCRFRPGPWILRWYVDAAPGVCRIESREIVIV